ncbi:MAG: hypothetical protein M1819_001912 [Sarea resinae]|nr:MAG: hypothetical protein M1819_001912 [Sarea resinae]
MSGIEVAGLVLGAIPLLPPAFDLYKKGLRRVGIAFKKRQYIEKLTLALLSQQQVLEGTLKLVVLKSGCKDVSRLEDDPYEYLKDEDVCEQIQDYLGPKNYRVFDDMINESSDIVKRLARSIAGLVPAIEGPTDDLLEIINANRDSNGMRRDISGKIKLMFEFKELKDAIVELDENTNTFDRFTRITLTSHDIAMGTSSRKADKLARALRQVRDLAGHLYLAIVSGWRAGCHSKHETKLFLEDRVDTATDILRRTRQDSSVPILVFQLIFAASLDQGKPLWYETNVQVFKLDTDSAPGQISSNWPSGSARPKMILPQTTPGMLPRMNPVTNICSAIEAARFDRRQVAFALSKNRKIGTISTAQNTLIPQEQADTMTLKALLLRADASIRRNSILPWKFRMLLALRLASNLLQLLQTRWLEKAWSKDDVCFLLRSTGQANDVTQGQKLDADRPFVSVTFDGVTRNTQSQRNIDPKIVLLELGILLLEIWHERTLESRFPDIEAPKNPWERFALAARWLDDTSNPLLDLYRKAVSRCIQAMIPNESRARDWEDIKVWQDICEGVIEPLAKNCKQWR